MAEELGIAVGTLQSVLNYGMMFFNPSFLMRYYELPMRDAAWQFGLVSAGMGFIGPLIWGPLSDRLNLRFPGAGRAWVGVLTGTGLVDGEVGGVVRDTLAGQMTKDIDLATPLLPEKVIEKLSAAGIKCVPTGMAHGTVTLVVDGEPFDLMEYRRVRCVEFIGAKNPPRAEYVERKFALQH